MMAMMNYFLQKWTTRRQDPQNIVCCLLSAVGVEECVVMHDLHITIAGCSRKGLPTGRSRCTSVDGILSTMSVTSIPSTASSWSTRNTSKTGRSTDTSWRHSDMAERILMSLVSNQALTFPKTQFSCLRCCTIYLDNYKILFGQASCPMISETASRIVTYNMPADSVINVDWFRTH